MRTFSLSIYRDGIAGQQQIYSLTDSQLNRPGQTVFGHHPTMAILVIGRTVLKLTSLLQQAFLGCSRTVRLDDEVFFLTEGAGVEHDDNKVAAV